MYIALVFGKKSHCESPLPISSQTEPVAKYTVKIMRLDAVIDPPGVASAVYNLSKKTNRRVGLNTICEFIEKKFAHCLQSKFASKGVRGYVVVANLEWVQSVVETEFDYHIGKRECAKKRNAVYMDEYKATSLSGFGARFYHPENKISNSIIAKLYEITDLDF